MGPRSPCLIFNDFFPSCMEVLTMSYLLGWGLGQSCLFHNSLHREPSVLGTSTLQHSDMSPIPEVISHPIPPVPCPA